VRFVRRRRELFCVAGLWADDPHQKENLLSASTGDLSRSGNDERNLPTAKAHEGRASGRERVIGIKGEVSKQIARSFVLLTTAANPSVAPIHDRMPFIVRDDQLDRWLNNSDSELPSSILHLLDKNPLDFYPVSREVNNVRNEHPGLIRPAPVEKELF